MDSTAGASDEVELGEQVGFLEARFLGSFSVERVKRQQAAAAKACLERKQGKLLVDLTRLDARPSTVDRYELASHAVGVAATLKVALFVTPSFMDRKKIGILFAQNRGLTVEAFTDRQKAVDWLLDPTTDAPAPDRGTPAS